MHESDLAKKQASRIRDRGGWARKTHGNRFTSGLPDVIGTYRSVSIGVETKLPGKEHTLTKLQAATLAEIRKAGGVAVVATTVRQVDDLLNRIDRVLDERRRRRARERPN